MKGSNLGELEELILLTVGILYQKAYGVAVMDEIENQTGRSLNISGVHAVLQRLEEKGLLKSEMSEPTGERGGRRKRLFMLTAAGKRSLEDAKEQRNQLFNQIPKVAMQFENLTYEAT
jgi:DNA-binding PadR family transcriptional regulator